MPWGQEAYYCLASFPPHDISDAKWMASQDRFDKYQTPAELYEALPLARPPQAGGLHRARARGDAQVRREVDGQRPEVGMEPTFQHQALGGQTTAGTRATSGKRVQPPATLQDYEIANV